MRQIKFRGKRNDTGEWVYGDLVRNVEGAFAVIPPYQMNMKNVCSNYEVEIESVGQFTGLLDAKQKEIYEGDILSANGRVVGWVKGGVRGYCYDVVYVNHPAGEKRWTLYATVMDDYKGKIEITGNIHDNPELITSKQ